MLLILVVLPACYERCFFLTEPFVPNLNQSVKSSTIFQERLNYFLWNFCRGFFDIILVIANVHKIFHNCRSSWEIFLGIFVHS